MEAMEQLEGREMFSAGADPVTLTRADGAARSIVGRRDTWIVIHGWTGSKDDAPMRALGKAVDGMSRKDQVLMMDWRDLAKATPDQKLTEANSARAAKELAALIRSEQLPARRINLIGYSMGAFVADRVAAELHDTGGVNRIVALDPASPRSRINKHQHSAPAPVNLARDSAYSIAFHGVNVYSPAVAAMSADDTVRVDNIGTTNLERHAGVLDIFTTMVKRNEGKSADAVSRVFSLKQITAGAMPKWRRDALEPYGGAGYEAVVTAETAGGAVAPAMLTYVNQRGRTVRIW